ncbi:hypothetical protein COV18_06590 [Candidatus Woesearchaeota archaeon CG10_big_fil_rev_8_21_14_0_10_37_12]|nr:MAG: hypothetical protein COV18_06590 [Candidatus Woesearchaeota archaeon CG10_big_fil_rev_8_21_14_0_10_37_12]
MVQETLNIQKIGEQVLDGLQQFNQKIWSVLSFSLIHAELSQEKELKDVPKNVQNYRRERWEKALAKCNGDKRKAYELMDSENFY